MTTPNILERNRVILCHFDSYSAALHFARYGDSILAPAPLPANASAIDAPGAAAQHHSPGPIVDALAAQYGLDPAQLRLDDDFEAWLADDSGPVRVHLVRFTTFDAPHAAIEPMGGVFKPISQMRGMPPLELNLMRQVFNLIIGG
jgi:hypothetical protein